ncbi:TetR family transcriptional regulator [Herbihabitans rhizosphaerae]|uniref:TetR family transcriptional regulator n=1 Tax=Herbihabitans rhizosphaerae TaxID=1872711 RepID=A0A4Q7KEG2_9PSEU|nr:TetR/AcrR family transcriptional regulator [Herbihabitans rhizosphaerae]RZS31230.1 TetR family transcriptional regulator [Herbihabitans rhizosphaerae]
MAKTTRDPESRHRIVRAAWRLVGKQGVPATTVRGIAVEAGVSTGSVTHYFEDKAEIMSSVLRYNNRLMAERIGKSIGRATGLAAVERIAQAMLPLDNERLRTWNVLIAFWGQSGAWAHIDQRSPDSGYGGLRMLVIEAFADARRAGELPSDTTPAHEAERLLVLVFGLSLMAGGFPALLGNVARRSRTMLAEHIAALRTKENV